MIPPSPGGTEITLTLPSPVEGEDYNGHTNVIARSASDEESQETLPLRFTRVRVTYSRGERLQKEIGLSVVSPNLRKPIS